MKPEYSAVIALWCFLVFGLLFGFAVLTGAVR